MHSEHTVKEEHAEQKFGQASQLVVAEFANFPVGQDVSQVESEE